jgi:hypothetical protein
MLAAATNFRDTIVRLISDGFELLDERAFQRPTRGIGGKSRFARNVQGIQNFAVDIKLNLPGRGVADPDRRRLS